MSTNPEMTTTIQALKPSTQSTLKPDFRVYRSPQTNDNVATNDVPEAFFTPSTADLKMAQASLSAKTQALTNAPLRTQAMRDAELRAKLAKYPETKIRVRFGDRTQLEKTFPSTDKIRSVYAFVRGALREDVKPIKFVLYQTPPKRELKVSDPQVRDLNLLQLQLAPSSVLHLKFEDETLNHVNIPAPLDSAVLALAEDLPIPPTYDSPLSSEQSSGRATPNRSNPSASGSSSTDKPKLPKWLKLGPNK